MGRGDRSRQLLLKLIEQMDNELDLVIGHSRMTGDAELLIGDEC